MNQLVGPRMPETHWGECIVCPTLLLHPEAVAPSQSSPFDMGHDITTVAGLHGLEDESPWSDKQLKAWDTFEQKGYLYLPPGGTFLFRTGFKQAIQPGWGCLLWDRSGMGAVKRIHRFAGVIDETYRGEWFVRLHNFGDESHVINPGDRIVQGVYTRRVNATCPIVDKLPSTERGINGLGSSGA